MIDNILIVLILLSIVISIFIVKIWKKKYFVKELYIGEGVSVVLYVITIAITIGLLTIYCIVSKGLSYSWLYLVIVLIFDLLLLFVYCITATTFIYLKDKMLIKMKQHHYILKNLKEYLSFILVILGILAKLYLTLI